MTFSTNDPRYPQDVSPKRIQTIDEPVEGNERIVISQLKEAIETLAGIRGDQKLHSVSFNDLANIGLVTFREGGELQNNNIQQYVEPWHEVGSTGEPAFQNSWVNFGGADAVAAFYKDNWKRVHIKGLVKTGTAGTIFTLPVGYRPSETLTFATASNNAYGEFTIASNGNLAYIVGSNVDFSLNCSFRAET